MGPFGVTQASRDALMGHHIENRFSCFSVEREQVPLMRALIVRGSDIPVEPNLKLGFTGTDRGGDEDPVAPNDGSGMRESGDWGFPEDVFSSFDIPRCGRGLTGVQPAGPMPSKLRPVFGAVANAGQR